MNEWPIHPLHLVKLLIASSCGLDTFEPIRNSLLAQIQPLHYDALAVCSYVFSRKRGRDGGTALSLRRSAEVDLLLDVRVGPPPFVGLRRLSGAKISV